MHNDGEQSTEVRIIDARVEFHQIAAVRIRFFRFDHHTDQTIHVVDRTNAKFLKKKQLDKLSKTSIKK